MNQKVPELAIARWWSTSDLSEPLACTDGRTVSVVYRGRWTHGLGPDFQEAMIDFGDGHLHVGSIEIHERESDWMRHGHYTDSAYDDCVLHVVLKNDLDATRTSNGAEIPVALVAIAEPELQQLAHSPGFDWNRVGGKTCAASIAADRPEDIRAILQYLGDLRHAAKAARLEGQISLESPAQVLYREILDCLGFMSNREPMKQVGSAIPIQTFEQILASSPRYSRATLAQALFFGVGGFLPFSPAQADLLGFGPHDIDKIESAWNNAGTAVASNRLPVSAWNLARVRPANHPIRRLASGAAIMSNTSGGFIHDLLEPIRGNTDIVESIQNMSTIDGVHPLGRARASGIAINAVLPFAHAYARVNPDEALAESVSVCWEGLQASETSSVTRRAMGQVAGNQRIRSIGARGQQGLIHLDATLCNPRRCFECPIAHLVMMSSPEKPVE